MSKWALTRGVLICHAAISSVFAIHESTATRRTGCSGGCDGEQGRSNLTTTAQQIADDFRDFFEVGIREFDSSSDEQFASLRTVALWYKAISRLDIPDEDDESDSNLTKMKRLLSSLMVEIGDAAYPDPSSPNDPNHDWEGRAGGERRWKKHKNRANHDSLNLMRSAVLSLHFVHLVQRYRPDLWARILLARHIDPGSEGERLYLLNIFVAGYMMYILRYDEAFFHQYRMSDDANAKFVKYMCPEVARPELKSSLSLAKVASAWLHQKIGQTDYYKPLLGKHLTHMVMGLLSDNVVKGVIRDPNGEVCEHARGFLYDEYGKEYDIDTVDDDILATHFEMGVAFSGHHIDHVRIGYSHFTKPRGCWSTGFRLFFETIFEGDTMQRARESYSVWTYLIQQTGTLISKKDREVFQQMKAPSEIDMEMGKDFFESNPWAKTIYKKWRNLANHSPKSEEQKRYHALCKDFKTVFTWFFSREHLYSNLDEETAKFFDELFLLSNEDCVGTKPSPESPGECTQGQAG